MYGGSAAQKEWNAFTSSSDAFAKIGRAICAIYKVCNFNGIEFTEKGVCRIVFATLVLRFLSYLVTVGVGNSVKV